MKRPLLTAAAAASLLAALPATAGAKITEIGTTTTPATPTCPSTPCLAVSRTTGYQVKLGTVRDLVSVPANGRIVAWSVTLGKPAAKQVTFFNANEGGPASAGISVLRAGKHLTFRLLAQSPIQQLQPYFGETAQFPLDQTIPVLKGQVIALTVPTWAPALAIGYRSDTSWRASRPKKGCSNTTTQTAQTTVGQVAQYFCLYRTARLTYSATLVTTP